MNTQPIKLCARTDIPEGEMIEMSVPGTDNSLLLVSTKGAIRAFQNKCPHMDIPLCQGAFDGEVITCTEPVSYTHLDVYKRQRVDVLEILPCPGNCKS